MLLDTLPKLCFNDASKLVGTQTIGMPMKKCDMHHTTLELRILTAIIGKVSHMNLEQRLQELHIELSWLQHAILRMLAFEGNQTISMLSKTFMVDPSTLVPAVDSLERKGLILRQRDPNDRRRIPLAVTEAGQNLLLEISVVHDDDPLLVSLENMEASRVDDLLTLMRDLIRNFPDGEQMLANAAARIRTQQHAIDTSMTKESEGD